MTLDNNMLPSFHIDPNLFTQQKLLKTECFLAELEVDMG